MLDVRSWRRPVWSGLRHNEDRHAVTRTSGLQRTDTDSARVITAVPLSAASRDSSRSLGRLEVELLAAEPLEGGLMIDLTASPPVLVVRGVDHQPLRTDAPSLPSRIAVRSLDLLIAVPAFLLAFPVILLLLAAVWLASPGPALFASRRITRDGRFFDMWKLRTMVVDGPEVLAEHFRQHPEDEATFQASMKLEHDPRVTKLGHVLRRWSLDELPQLWNVIRGHMSIVGPRPLLAEEAKRMGRAFPTVVRVKGGLTGLWQISGRSTLTFEERVPLDVEYANDRTLGRDLRILLTTIGQLLRGRPGAF